MVGLPETWQRRTPRKSQSASAEALEKEKAFLDYVSQRWVQSARMHCGTLYTVQGLQSPSPLPPWSNSLMDTYSKP